jgi:transcriptional regulator with XRE-family HTH domain
MRTAGLIREARLRAGLTQRDLASRLGTTQSAIARWEAGRAQPSLETVSKLVGACGLELRVNLADADPGDASLIERTLRLTPEQRFDELVRTVAFIQAGREALAKQLG